jgi:predicted Zn-dependent peptidase
MTSFFFTASEGFEQNLLLLLSSVSSPYFTPETVAKELPIIIQEAKGRMDTPAVAGSENLLSLLHPYHPIRYPL